MFIHCLNMHNPLLLDVRAHRHHVPLYPQLHQLVVTQLLLLDQVLGLLLSDVELGVDFEIRRVGS